MNNVAEIAEFWDQARRDENWFSKNPAFDADFRARFLTSHEDAARGAYETWLAKARGKDGQRWRHPLLLTVNAVAAGMRNTG